MGSAPRMRLADDAKSVGRGKQKKKMQKCKKVDDGMDKMRGQSHGVFALDRRILLRRLMFNGGGVSGRRTRG